MLLLKKRRGGLMPYVYHCTTWLGPSYAGFLPLYSRNTPQIWCFLFSKSDKERSHASLWLSGVKRNERKEKPFLSVEVGSYHFEVWGAAVCCTFLFARFAKVPHSFSWWASLGRKKQKSHADKPFLGSLGFPDT